MSGARSRGQSEEKQRLEVSNKLSSTEKQQAASSSERRQQQQQEEEEKSTTTKKSQSKQRHHDDEDKASKQIEAADSTSKQPTVHPVPSTSSRAGARVRPAPPKRLELRGRVVPVEPSTLQQLSSAPKRPAQLPASYAAPGRPGAVPVQLSGGARPSGSPSKPNRYSWAQLQQHWREHPQSAPCLEGAASLGPSGGGHFQGASRSVGLVVNPMQMVNLSEHTKSRLIKIIEALKRFSEQWFSHVLLLMFLAVYACFGAYVFINFEASTEQREKEVIIESRQQILEKVWRSARNDSKGDFSQLMIHELESYERLLARACASGMTSNSLENQWTFWGALFYSMTVFTTIGYGHLTPVTFAGRVATMVYAIFGIPILLMVLADLGKLLTRIIKFTFKQFRLLRHKLLHWRASVRTRRIISERTREGVSVLRSASTRAITRLRPAWFRCPTRLVRLLERFKEGGGRPKEPASVVDPNSPSLSGTRGTSPDQAAGPANGADNPPTPPDAVDNKQQQQQLITPPKQTKPISPSVQSGRPTFGTLASHALQHHHYHGYPHSHYHGQSMFWRSSHSRGRRGELSGSLMSNRHHRKGSSSERQPHQSKQHKTLQVSRSSSSSVALPTPTSPHSKIADFTIPPQSGGDQAESNHRQSSDISQDPHERTAVQKPREAKEVADEEDELYINDTNFEDHSLELSYQQRFHVGQEPNNACNMDADGDDDDEFRLVQEDDFDIPVSFALFLLVTYMMFGAVVFSIWEGWNFFDSLYFVFISMSTIGFGDLVPQHPKRMIGTFIYLLFGLALTSMCINVVQEKIHATFLRAKMQIGEKMGLDLDQIMADDYYEGSLIDEYCDAECLSENTNSHTNDSDHHHHHQQQQQQNLYNEIALDSASPSAGELTASNSIRMSRSNHSFRSKFRRPAQASLPGHNASGASTGSLLRRQPSRRLISRQFTPSSPPSESVQLTGDSAACRADRRQSSGTLEAGGSRLSPATRSSSQHATSVEEQLTTSRSPVSELFPAPIGDKNESAQTGGGRRSRLTGTRSQPENSLPQASRSVEEKAAPLPLLKAAEQPPAPEGAKTSSELRTRSAGSSRRSSVSQELNQLDDLILTLSRSAANSQDGPFGPLLGIPSSASSTTLKSLQSQFSNRKSGLNTNCSSHPNSPTNSNLLPIPRRGASMTSRRSFTPNASSSAGRKISSPSFELASKSNNLLKTKSNSNKVSSIDVAIANSQMAIEELEAVKLSIV